MPLAGGRGQSARLILLRDAFCLHSFDTTFEMVMGVFPSRRRRRPPKWPAKALFRFALGNLLLANLDLSSRRRRPRSTSAPVAWQVLRLGQARELRRHFGGESEFKLDQTPAHEGAEVIAPHEFLVWRIEVFERLTAQAPP